MVTSVPARMYRQSSVSGYAHVRIRQINGYKSHRYSYKRPHSGYPPCVFIMDIFDLLCIHTIHVLYSNSNKK